MFWRKKICCKIYVHHLKKKNTVKAVLASEKTYAFHRVLKSMLINIFEAFSHTRKTSGFRHSYSKIHSVFLLCGSIRIIYAYWMSYFTSTIFFCCSLKFSFIHNISNIIISFWSAFNFG